MPLIEDAFLLDDAVLWRKTGHNDQGEAAFAEPEGIKCRWNWRKSQMIGPDGSTVALDAQVVVDREIEDGSLMWHGKLEDWYLDGSGGHELELMEVKTYREARDVKGRETGRELGLAFYRSRKP